MKKIALSALADGDVAGNMVTTVDTVAAQEVARATLR